MRQDLGIERLKARNGQSVRKLSALTSDLHCDQYQSVARCARSTNRCLLDSTTIVHCFRSKNDDDTVSNVQPYIRFAHQDYMFLAQSFDNHARMIQDNTKPSEPRYS